MSGDVSDFSGARLDEYTKEEWWDVCREVAPWMEREEFERHWEEFSAMKRVRTECAGVA